MYVFFIHSGFLWHAIKAIYLWPSFLTNATEIFAVIGNNTYENQATLIYGLENFKLESLSVNKRDKKIEVGIKIPKIKVREINFKLLIFSIYSSIYSIYGKYFCQLVLIFQHFQAIARWRVHARYKGFPRVKDWVSQTEKGSLFLSN